MGNKTKVILDQENVILLRTRGRTVATRNLSGIQML